MDLPLLPQGLVQSMSMSSGVRFAMQTNAERLWLDVTPLCFEPDRDNRIEPPTVSVLAIEHMVACAGLLAPAIFDLMVNGVLHDRREVPPVHDKAVIDGSEGMSGLPPGEFTRQRLQFELPPGDGKVVELWLPQGHGVRIHEVGLGAGSLRPSYSLVDSRPVLTVYGSSISQGVPVVSGPSETWPAIVARRAHLDLMCLGLAGQCHLDQSVARLVREVPAIACLILEVGINVFAHRTLNRRTFVPAVLAFIHTVRDRHPTVPILVISPIWSGAAAPSGIRSLSQPGEALADSEHHSLDEMRSCLSRMVDALHARGDRHVHHRCGLDLLGEFDASMACYMPDELHPTKQGHQTIANRLVDLDFAESVGSLRHVVQGWQVAD